MKLKEKLAEKATENILMTDVKSAKKGESYSLSDPLLLKAAYLAGFNHAKALAVDYAIRFGSERDQKIMRAMGEQEYGE